MELNTQELKDYLFHVRDLELSCYKQRQYIAEIERMRSEAPPRQLSFKKEPEVKPSGLVGSFIASFIASFIMCARIGAIILLVALGIPLGIGLILSLYSINQHFLSTLIDFISTLVAKCGGFKQLFFIAMALLTGFGLVGAAFTFIPFHRDELVKFQKTKQDNIEKALQIEEQNRKINSEFSPKKSIVEEEYSKAATALRSTEQTLAQFYNAGVVYQKYQGLIPITMFCEYIASGRCTDLVGHEGAYNIYESEIRLNLIIIKLNDIIKRLNEIKENQYMLADMMQKANRELENLTNIAAQQAQSLNRIEANTTVVSYYSGISVMNTTYLAWAKHHEMLS